MLEAIDAKLPLVVCITEGIPTLDMVRVAAVLRAVEDAADRAELSGDYFAGEMQNRNHAGTYSQGREMSALVSRSGTLTYEAVDQLTRLGIGQSTCIGIGGDPIIGTTLFGCD